jgi:hypothetical protein
VSRKCLDARPGPARPGNLRTRDIAGRRSGRVDGCHNRRNGFADDVSLAALALAAGGGCGCCWGRRRRLLLGEEAASNCCLWSSTAGIVVAVFCRGGVVRVWMARGPAAAGRGPSLSARGWVRCAARPPVCIYIITVRRFRARARRGRSHPFSHSPYHHLC